MCSKKRLCLRLRGEVGRTPCEPPSVPEPGILLLRSRGALEIRPSRLEGLLPAWVLVGRHGHCLSRPELWCWEKT